MSPTPTISKNISIVCASASEGATVTAFNRTTGETTTAKVKSGKVMLDMANLTPTGYSTGDVIEFRIAGDYYPSENNTLTLTASTAAPQSLTITMTQNTTTNAPGIVF